MRKTMEDENQVHSDENTEKNEDNKDIAYWKAEAAKHRAIAERRAEKLVELSAQSQVRKEESNDTDSVAKLKQELDTIKLRQDGYTPEQIDVIMSMGGYSALTNEKIAKAVKLIGNTDEDRATASADIPSGASSNYTTPKPNSTDLKKMSVKDLEEMKAKFLK